jgi:hypothetical protein
MPPKLSQLQEIRNNTILNEKPFVSDQIRTQALGEVMQYDL